MIKYYDINNTLSKQRLFNFVIGGRGMGKTYGCKKKVIENFLKKGEQFFYLRRFDTDVKPSEIRNFFNDVEAEFPGVEFRVYNGCFLINGEVAGWYKSITTAVQLRSVPFPNVTLIIFDEFIVNDGAHRYLPGEVTGFLDCYSTIARDRDVPVLFLSNAITMTNPYFMYFNITFEHGQRTKLTEFISVELVYSETYAEHIKETKFGKLIAGTQYGDFNIENKFILDTETFISKMPAGASYLCTFIVSESATELCKAGLYLDSKQHLYYISNKVDQTNQRTYSLTMRDHSPDTILALRQNPYIRVMVDAYCSGKVRFTSQNVKNLLTPVIKRMM